MPDPKTSPPSSAWADRFFGPLYGELYRRHLLEPERSAEEAAFASEILELPGKRVLDLAAGFGRHARQLVPASEVVALDLNLQYLQTALRGLRGKARRNLHAVRADMRTLPLSNRAFDAVLFLFNSFGYFSAEAAPPPAPAPGKQQVWRLPDVFYQRDLVSKDFGASRPAFGSSAPAAPGGGEGARREPTPDRNLDVLREIARVLRPGGGLLMEVPNPRPLIEAVRSAPRRHVITGSYEIQEEYSYDPESRILRNRTRFRLGRREEDGEYALRLYERAELVAALRDCGLTVSKTFGDYEGSPYSASRSDTMLLLARRRGR